MFQICHSETLSLLLNLSVLSAPLPYGGVVPVLPLSIVIVSIYGDASHGVNLLLLTYTRAYQLCAEYSPYAIDLTHSLQHPCETVLFFHFYGRGVRGPERQSACPEPAHIQLICVDPIFLLPFSTIALTPDLFLLNPVTLSLKISQAPPAFTLCHGLCPARFLL